MYYPELFKMEYHFNNGEAVDAIVRVGDFITPIDFQIFFRQLQ